MMKNIVIFVTFLLVAGDTLATSAINFQVEGFKDSVFQDVTHGKFVIGNNGRELYLPNQKRASDPALLKLIFPGSSDLAILKVTGSTPNLWSLHLNDGTTMHLSAEQSLVDVDAVQQFSIYWPGVQPKNHANKTNNNSRELCISYGYRNASWYNGYQSLAPSWPMDTSRVLPVQPFNNVRNFTYDPKTEDFHQILEQLFVNSDGFAVTFDHRTPLFLRRDPNLVKAHNSNTSNTFEPLLCFSANNSGPYDHLNTDADYRALRMHIFIEKNTREVVDYTVRSSGAISRLEAIPDEAKFRFPTWSIEGASSVGSFAINQAAVLQFAKQIVEHGFSSHSQLMFDDYLQREHNSMELTASQYPHPKELLATLKGMGFTRLGMTAVAATSKYRSGFKHGDNSTAAFFIPYYNASNPTGVNSTDVTSVIDFSSADACEWYQYLLHRAKYEYGFSAFQLEGVSIRWLMGFRDRAVHRSPALITKRYVECAAQLGREVVSDVGYGTQHLPNFVRLTRDRYNRAGGYEQQLADLIPNVLAVSLAGYAFVVPYQVGGFSREVMPSPELYIRWVQAVALMPALHFFHAPWSYVGSGAEHSELVLNLTRRYVALHEHFSPEFIRLAGERVSKGSPIVRPLWYEAPEDAAAYYVGDQFMLGSNILVAPVLRMNQTERTVYLPINGSTWTDQHGARYAGGQTIRVKAPLEELPYFTRVQRKLCSFCEGL